jgi:hypothetical protein
MVAIDTHFIILAQLSEGIPHLPDLTHPQEFIQFGASVARGFLALVVLVGFLGIAIALLNVSLRQVGQSVDTGRIDTR